MNSMTTQILMAAATAAAIAEALGAPIDVNEALRVGRLNVLFDQDIERIICLRHERKQLRRPIVGATTLSEDAQLLGARLLGKSGLSLKARQY